MNNYFERTIVKYSCQKQGCLIYYVDIRHNQDVVLNLAVQRYNTRV